MTVYVDEPLHKLGRMIMCHMIATDRDELHEMAKKIGIRRAWFQSKGKYPHYDICKSKRAEAVALGAIEVSSRELVVIAKLVKENESR